MHLVKSAMAALLGAALLVGCGGGGGGNSPGTPPPISNTPPPVVADGSWLTLTPGTVALKNYQGETTRFTIKATSTRTFDKPFNAAVIDDKGLVSPQISISKQSDLEYIVGLQTASLAAGTHTTKLQVRLCEDDPKVCSKPLPGSPWSVPLTVEVAPATQAQERVTITPAAVDLVTYDGEAVSMQMGVKLNTTFDVPVRIGVFGGAGVIAPDVMVTQDGPGQYRARLTTAAALAQGEHTATLELRLCYDDPRECASPVVGSPWRVPVKVTVKPGTNLTTLAAIPGLASWSNDDGNAAHSNYVAASFDPARFTRRWSKPATALGPMGAPAIVNGKLFTVRGNRFGNNDLLAIDEASGAILWSTSIGSGYEVGPPAAVDGKVVLNTDGIYNVRAFDQATGQSTADHHLPIYSNCRSSTVAGGMVYGSYDRISKFNPATGLVEWSNGVVEAHACAPSVDGSMAYAYTANKLQALDTATGSLAYSIADQGNTVYNLQGSPVVLGSGMAFVIDGKRLLGFDLNARSRAWALEGKPVGQPVFANGIVYALAEDGNEVEARAAATGALQWKSAGLTNWSLYTPYERMAVTSNLLFVSGSTTTVALDLASHQVVWSYPLGGELAISDRGVLYIFAANGQQVAINLR